MSSKNKLEKNEIETLRPQKLNEYVGQDNIKKILSISLNAAKSRNETIDHILLHGPSGLGKTTLAEIIANEMGGGFRVITGGSIEKPGDLVSILSNLNPGDILFIDEIHRLQKIIEEILYSAMEDYTIDIILDRNYDSKPIRLDLVPFTLIGATTMVGRLSKPLRDRFSIQFRLNYYNDDEIAQIIKRTSGIYNIKTDKNAISEITKRARGTPRIANQQFLRLRDFAEVKNKGHLTKEIALSAYRLLKVDENGLTSEDFNYLNILINHFAGGPVGIDSLATALQEAAITLTNVYEPYLIKEGYIKYTPSGRVALNKAYKIVKLGIFNNE